MAFIRTIPPSEADGPAREMYEQVRGRYGSVPNWATIFSLRPAVMEGWGALLKSIQSNLPVRTYELATLARAARTKPGGTISVPSSTAPLRTASAMPAPRKNPPNTAVSNGSCVTSG